MTRSPLLTSCVLPLVLSACSGGGSGPAAVAKPLPDGDPSAPSSPRISGTPSSAAFQGAPYAFRPTATDPDGDPLTFEVDNLPPWATFDPQTGTLDGMPAASDIGLYSGIQIRVSDGSSWVALPTFDIVVQAVANGGVLVTWLPPTENTDDSPLQDLAGFNVYWGTELGDLPNRVTIESPGVTAQMFADLAPGTYYFATTAFNAAGLESDLSETATVIVR